MVRHCGPAHDEPSTAFSPDRSNADDIKQPACPKRETQPGSPCRSRGGAVASVHRTHRFTPVPRQALAARPPGPRGRRPGPAERGHAHRLRPLFRPRAGTRLPAQRPQQARHPEGRDLQRESRHPGAGVRPRFEEALKTAREVKAHAPRCRTSSACTGRSGPAAAPAESLRENIRESTLEGLGWARTWPRRQGQGWRSVKLVCQYAATSSTRPYKGSPHGRPRRTSATPSRRSAVTNLPKQRGLSPVNGAVQEGPCAVITPSTARSSHWSHLDAAGLRHLVSPEGHRPLHDQAPIRPGRHVGGVLGAVDQPHVQRAGRGFRDVLVPRRNHSFKAPSGQVIRTHASPKARPRARSVQGRATPRFVPARPQRHAGVRRAAGPLVPSSSGRCVTMRRMSRRHRSRSVARARVRVRHAEEAGCRRMSPGPAPALLTQERFPRFWSSWRPRQVPRAS